MAVDMATGEVVQDVAELPGLLPRPSWQELGFAFARVENAQAQVDDLASDLKEAKEELKQAQQALYAMGKRVRR